MPKRPRTWVIADTHFGHANIIGYTGRPFRNVEEMDRALVANWNATVDPGDTVYHLGDFSGPPMNERIEAIAEQLRGRIVLIAGNHDRVSPRMAGTFRRVTGPQRVRVDVKGHGRAGVVLSHVPLHAAGTGEAGGAELIGNLHGHIHERTSPTPRHCNMCVEHTDYRPMRLEEAVRRLMAQIGSGRPQALDANGNRAAAKGGETAAGTTPR